MGKLQGGWRLATKAHLRLPLLSCFQHLSQNSRCSQDGRFLNCLYWEVAVKHLEVFREPVRIVPSARTTTGTTLHLTPHNLPSSLHSSLYFSIFSSSLVLTLVSPGTAMSTIRPFLVSLFRTMISGLLAAITRSVKTLKSQNNFTLSFSLTFSALCWHHCSLCSRSCF